MFDDWVVTSRVDRLFPWILTAFSLHAYGLSKIIELFIRSDDSLSRDVIKHLNSIEKQILESYAWKTDSPLWNVLREAGNHVPVFDEVVWIFSSSDIPRIHVFHVKICLSSSSLNQSANSSDLIINLTPNPVTLHASSSSCTNSPVKHPAITRVVCASGGDTRFLSPSKKNETIITQTSMTQINRTNSPNERFVIQSPNLKRQLFTTTISTSQSMHSVLGNFYHSFILTLTSSLPHFISTISIGKKKNASSLNIFFRKFYHLASTRLLEFIERLDLQDQITKKIWNIFEYSVVYHIDLIRDRHLDQIIMSAIYVTSKVDGFSIYDSKDTFANWFYFPLIVRFRTRASSSKTSWKLTGSNRIQIVEMFIAMSWYKRWMPEI